MFVPEDFIDFFELNEEEINDVRQVCENHIKIRKHIKQISELCAEISKVCIDFPEGYIKNSLKNIDSWEELANAFYGMGQ